MSQKIYGKYCHKRWTLLHHKKSAVKLEAFFKHFTPCDFLKKSFSNKRLLTRHKILSKFYEFGGFSICVPLNSIGIVGFLK